MDDFVRRSDILTALHSGNIDLGFVYKETYRKLREYSREVDKVIKSIPAADVAPVRRGKWINENIVLTTDPPQYQWHCSECGEIKHGFDSNVLTNYCPNCGAKMEG